MLSTWTRGAFVRGGRREVRGRRAYILRRQPEQGVHATTVGECGGLLHSVQRLSRARAACALSGRDLELRWLLLLAHRGQNLVSKTRWRETPSHGLHLCRIAVFSIKPTVFQYYYYGRKRQEKQKKVTPNLNRHSNGENCGGRLTPPKRFARCAREQYCTQTCCRDT